MRPFASSRRKKSEGGAQGKGIAKREKKRRTGQKRKKDDWDTRDNGPGAFEGWGNADTRALVRKRVATTLPRGKRSIVSEKNPRPDGYWYIGKGITLCCETASQKQRGGNSGASWTTTLIQNSSKERWEGGRTYGEDENACLE